MLIYRNIKKSLNQNYYINIHWIYLYDIHTSLYSYDCTNIEFNQ